MWPFRIRTLWERSLCSNPPAVKAHSLGLCGCSDECCGRSREARWTEKTIKEAVSAAIRLGFSCDVSCPTVDTDVESSLSCHQAFTPITTVVDKLAMAMAPGWRVSSELPVSYYPLTRLTHQRETSQSLLCHSQLSVITAKDKVIILGAKELPNLSLDKKKRIATKQKPLQLDLVEIVVSSRFFALHGLSNLCISLLVILSPSLKVTSNILSRPIGALSWSFMATFVDNKYMSHKTPQDIFKGSLAFGGIVNSYFSGSLIDTYGVGNGIRFGFSSWFNLLVNLPNDVVSIRDFIGFVIFFQIICVAPQRTRRGCGDRYVSGVREGLRWWEIAFPLKKKKLESSTHNIIKLKVVRQLKVFLLTFKQLCRLTLLCSRTTLPQILFAMFYFTINSLGFTLMGHVKLVTSIASLLGVGHYNGFMKNCTSPFVLSTFLLVHLHRMHGLSVGTHHDIFSLQHSSILISSFTLTTILLSCGYGFYVAHVVKKRIRKKSNQLEEVVQAKTKSSRLIPSRLEEVIPVEVGCVKMESRKSQPRPKPSRPTKVVMAERCRLQSEPTILDMIKPTLHGRLRMKALNADSRGPIPWTNSKHKKGYVSSMASQHEISMAIQHMVKEANPAHDLRK
ncbi:Folate-biopterin transporter 1, chloroplastic, partial [Mucuna pruriens]